MLRLLPFRARSTERDRQTDGLRRERVAAVLETVIGKARGELAGLEARVGAAYQNAARLLDSSGDYGERDPQDEQLIAGFEREARNATDRVEQLRNEWAFFVGMREALDGRARAVAPGQRLLSSDGGPAGRFPRSQ